MYYKLEKLKIELKRSLDDREKVIKRLEESKVRLESKLTLALKKKFVRTDVELRLQEVEKELEVVRESKYKLEDENAKLEKKIEEKERNAKKKDDQKKQFDHDLQEQKASYDKELKEQEKNTKSLRNELKKNDSDLKEKSLRIKELETSLDVPDVGKENLGVRPMKKVDKTKMVNPSLILLAT